MLIGFLKQTLDIFSLCLLCHKSTVKVGGATDTRQLFTEKKGMSSPGMVLVGSRFIPSLMSLLNKHINGTTVTSAGDKNLSGNDGKSSRFEETVVKILTEVLFLTVWTA